MTTEATLELGAYCPSGSTSCSSGCKAAVTRLSGLTCITTVSGSLGASYSDAVSLCCDNTTIQCPSKSESGRDTGLSSGGKAGVTIAVILVTCAAAGGAGYYFYKKKGLFNRNRDIELRDKRESITVVL